jgi:Cdc6-like AAA superfamily ATPase
MTDHQKKEIQLMLKKYVASYKSQKKAADSLRSVSEATIINIFKDKWESISDDMWRNIGKQVGYSKKGTWQMVPTVDSKTLIRYFEDAQEYGNVFAITAQSGAGKTFISQWYERGTHNVYHIECAEYFNRKVFLGKLLEKIGKVNTGYTVPEMMECILDELTHQESPLIILDEVDKLPDTVLYFFITLYNHLRDKCGIVMLATDHLNKKVMRGRKLNKRGYSEIFSRIGRRFISLRGTSKEEVAEICKANGLNEPTEINSIYNEYEGDLRRVERGVHRGRMRMRKAA